MNSPLIEIYDNASISFRTDGWVNATHMAKPFGKRTVDFLRLPSTKGFTSALADECGLLCENLTFAQPGRGGGTWMHPDLALEFARWLSPSFAIWTNRTIRKIMSGQTTDPTAERISAEVSRLITEVGNLTEVTSQLVGVAFDLHRRLDKIETKIVGSQSLRLAAKGGRPPDFELVEFLPVLRAVCPNASRTVGFNALHRACCLVRKIGGSAFARILEDGLKTGFIVRSADSCGYHLSNLVLK